MSDVTLAVSVLWVFLFTYSILGSIDFGAGFWSMYFSGQHHTKAGALANRYLSPTWEVTNVFLVLFVVALAGFFPKATHMLGAALLVPVSLVLLLLLVRSTFMVYAYSVSKHGRLLRVVSGITGLLIPGLLVSVLPITLGGFVTVENGVPVLHLGELFTSLTEYAHLGFGLSTELFMSALFLADYSREAGDEETYRDYRRLAIIWGPINLLMAMLTVSTFSEHAPWIVEGFKRYAFWFGLSVAAFIAAYILLLKRRPDGRRGYPRASIITVIIQYGLASYAYFSAHMPYMVYPHLTFDEGITNPTMFRSLFIGYIVSSAILVPVFYLFWRLFLKDKRYLQKE
ncbi:MULTISPECIES: cytochrome d ubiquinol oxidase subunit II [Paenibacillus]|uniref:cytochrome d ubiquinol oxidase subunit II n=1 Tax=Paenibacillus TaxID=44249 RepID=UPI001C2FD57D|nr:cytochrome d ubiquinol oxidase subunit II [Paenibacillus sp. GbtcB18]